MKAQYDEIGINKATYDLLFNDGIFLSESEYGSEENLKIIMLINSYTMDINKSIIKKLFLPQNLYSQFSYDKNSNIHTFKDQADLEIPFELISENITNISKQLKQELESPKRQKKCHKMSVNIGASFKDSKVLTGYIKLGKKYILHSVVLVTGEQTKKEKIIDYTKNLIMEKDKYIKLFDFQVLNVVQSEYLLSDLEILKKYGMDAISSKVYLNFRDELMNELATKTNLLETKENTKKI